MLYTVEGIYRNGAGELAEVPLDAIDGTRVYVTFLAPDEIDLCSRGFNPRQAADLRERLATFAEDWNSPEMADYDNYDSKQSAPISDS